MAEKDNRYIGNPFYYAYDRTHGITWNLFGECNFRCSYCIVPDDLSDSSAKAMHPEFSFDKLMGFYEENFSGSTNIHFIEASGEPTIHEHFKKILLYMLHDKNSHRIFINSNLSTPFWKEVDEDLSKLTITSFFHYEFADYDDYFSTRERLMKLGATVRGGLILTDYNGREVEKFSKRFDEEFPDYEYEIRVDYRKKCWKGITEEKFLEVDEFTNHDEKYDVWWDNDPGNSMYRRTKGMICGLHKHLINIEVNTGLVHQGNSNLQCGKYMNRILVHDLYSMNTIPDIIGKLNPVICKDDYCSSSCVSWMIPKYDVELYKRLIKMKRDGWSEERLS